MLYEVITEKLGAVEEDVYLSIGLDDLFDAWWFLALPIWAGKQEVTSAVAGGAATDIGKVVGIGVNELNRIIAILRNFRDGQHERFSPEIRAEEGIRRVRRITSYNVCYTKLLRVRTPKFNRRSDSTFSVVTMLV